MDSEIKETKICKKCGRELPLESFRLATGAEGYKYYRGSCRECDALYDKEYNRRKAEKEFTFSDDMDILITRKYKEIHPSRILDIAALDIIPLGTDEMFVKLMDYKDTWLSNYGRVIRYSGGTYSLLLGTYINNELRYTLPKNVFLDGKWIVYFGDIEPSARGFRATITDE